MNENNMDDVVLFTFIWSFHERTQITNYRTPK